MSEKFVYGEISFAGIPSVGGSFTLSHGARPSAAVLQFPRNQSIPTVGDMVIQGCDEFGNRASITFKSCFAASIQASAGGDPLIVARILDRRWAWDFAAISGHYNIRSESGDSIYNEKTPRELAILCLKVMGELNADLGDFDPQGRPPIDWELVNPARALEELVSEFGYVIQLGINNEVKIARAGDGSIDYLDRFTWLEDTIGVDMPPRPDGVIIAGGRTLWNMDLWLEPVGLELDGEWKNIEDLSYKPEKGWASTCLPRPPSNLKYPPGADSKTEQQIIQLAIHHVYRTYRICVRKPPHFSDSLRPDYGPYMKIVGYNGQVSNRWQLLPLESTQNLRDTTSSKPGSAARSPLLPKRIAPQIIGYFDSGEFGIKDAVTREELKGDQLDYRVFTQPYEIDYEKGLVHFEPLAVLIVDDKTEPARLQLRIATGIRDEQTREWKRHTIEHRFPVQYGAGMLIAPHDEIQLRISPDYDNSKGPVPASRYFDNKQEIEKEMKYYLTSIVQAMESRAARTGQFAGILPIEPSGRVQQITWSTGTGGPTTQFSANTEHNYNIPSYSERRLMNKLKEDKRKIAVPVSPGDIVRKGAPV